MKAGEFGDKQRANVKELGDDVVADIKSLRDALNAADDPEKKEEFKRANAVALADTAKVGAYAKPHYANDLENLVDELQGEIWDLSSAKEDGFFFLNDLGEKRIISIIENSFFFTMNL